MFSLESHRSVIEIVADILSLGEASITDIMHKAKLNHAQVKKHVTYLVKLKFFSVTQVNNKVLIYRITPRGIRLLREINDTLKTLDDNGTVDSVVRQDPRKLNDEVRAANSDRCRATKRAYLPPTIVWF